MNGNKKPSIIFFGTPRIAAEMLQTFIDLDIDIKAVVTKPDAFVGRKKEILTPLVKQLANKYNIDVLQPQKLDESFANQLEKYGADLFFVCAYGKIIPQNILTIPKYKCVNLHTSLLPRWRGGAPIHWAIVNGDNETGASLMHMTKELDAGDIIYQEAVPINDDETYDSLYLKLCNLGKQIIKKKYIDLFSDNVKCYKQESKMVTYAPNITRKDEFIDWNKPARLIIRKINGLYSKPIASTIYGGEPIKIFKASITNQKTVNHQPGTIISIDKNGIRITTNDYDIVVIIIQLPNKKPQAVNQLINGNHPFKILTQFSNNS